MHPTIQKFHDHVLANDHAAVPSLMAEDVRFSPPTYWATWNGREAVAAVLGHVGVDLITLNDDGLMQDFEVVMRPHKTIGALREAMNARVKTDPRFLKFRDALS